jgi:hypothetical protein
MNGRFLPARVTVRSTVRQRQAAFKAMEAGYERHGLETAVTDPVMIVRGQVPATDGTGHRKKKVGKSREEHISPVRLELYRQPA